MRVRRQNNTGDIRVDMCFKAPDQESKIKAS